MSKKKRSGGIEPEPHWKYVERVVGLLEQAIAPGARVEHNVKLLDYEAEIPRQCDVVIRQGTPPRETLTIVEVQDRNRRVTVTMFEGWCQKRVSVRAQHLICVSQKGFSRGVQQAMRKRNGTARLVELKELEEVAWPLKFRDGKWPLMWPEWELDYYSLKTVDDKTPGEKFKGRDVDFTRNGQPVRPGQLFEEFFPTIGCPPGDGEADIDQHIEFGRDDVLIVTWADGSARVDTITRRLKIRTRRVTLNVSTHEYKQIDYDGVLAWAITGTAEIDGQETALRVIFIPEPDGMLRLASIQTLGAFEDMPLASIVINYSNPQGFMVATFPRRRSVAAPITADHGLG